MLPVDEDVDLPEELELELNEDEEDELEEDVPDLDDELLLVPLPAEPLLEPVVLVEPLVPTLPVEVLVEPFVVPLPVLLLELEVLAPDDEPVVPGLADELLVAPVEADDLELKLPTLLLVLGCGALEPATGLF